MNADFFHEGQSKDKSVDYAISFDIETSKYIVDIFDAAITDADEAYIESVEYKNFADAVLDMNSYTLV